METKREGLNNKEIKKLLKENNTKMEIAKEVYPSKKVSDMLGDRLSKQRRFPPC